MNIKFWNREPHTSLGLMDEPEEYAIPQPHPVEDDTMSVDEMDEYAKLAMEIGMETNGAILSERIQRFLRDENIHVYDMTQVVPFLDKKLGKDWVWRGLRQKDADQFPAKDGWHQTESDGVRAVFYGEGPYMGAVPLPVLMTVKKIKDAFPQTNFFISDPKNGDGDPFLMVHSKNTDSFIVERWDEPDFRER